MGGTCLQSGRILGDFLEFGLWNLPNFRVIRLEIDALNRERRKFCFYQCPQGILRQILPFFKHFKVNFVFLTVSNASLSYWVHFEMNYDLLAIPSAFWSYFCLFRSILRWVLSFRLFFSALWSKLCPFAVYFEEKSAPLLPSALSEINLSLPQHIFSWTLTSPLFLALSEANFYIPIAFWSELWLHHCSQGVFWLLFCSQCIKITVQRPTNGFPVLASWLEASATFQHQNRSQIRP